MPRFRLDDGWTLNLPDDATSQEIAQIVADHYGVGTPVEALPAPEAQIPETASRLSDALQMLPDEPSDPAPDPIVAFGPPAPRFAVESYKPDDEADRDELTALLIEQLQRRSGRPDKRHPVFDPPSLNDIEALIRENYRPVLPRR